MKPTIFLIAFFLTTVTLSAQDFNKLANIIEFKTGDECRSYDSSALQCANYVLATPNNEDDNNRAIAMRFLIIWMMATPDYSFALDGNVTKLGSKKDNILGVYMASMLKYSMEHKDKASDQKDVAINTYHMVAEYCNNSANNIKPDKDLKKLIEADKNNTLKDYLKL